MRFRVGTIAIGLAIVAALLEGVGLFLLANDVTGALGTTPPPAWHEWAIPGAIIASIVMALVGFGFGATGLARQERAVLGIVLNVLVLLSWGAVVVLPLLLGMMAFASGA